MGSNFPHRFDPDGVPDRAQHIPSIYDLFAVRSYLAKHLDSDVWQEASLVAGKKIASLATRLVRAGDEGLPRAILDMFSPNPEKRDKPEADRFYAVDLAICGVAAHAVMARMTTCIDFVSATRYVSDLYYSAPTPDFQDDLLGAMDRCADSSPSAQRGQSPARGGRDPLFDLVLRETCARLDMKSSDRRVAKRVRHHIGIFHHLVGHSLRDTFEPNTKWILVAGSNQDGSQEAFDRFAVGCQTLGAELGRSGFAVVAGSFSPNTADHYVLRGALETPEARTLVIRPEREPQRPEDAIFRNVAVHSHPGDWSAVRSKQVARADAILLIAGGKGTGDILRAAQSGERSPPVLLLPAFGGLAATEYPSSRDIYRKLGVSEDRLKRLEQWDDSTPATVVSILQTLLGLPTKDEKVGPDNESNFVWPDSESDVSKSEGQKRATYLLTWDPGRGHFHGIERAVRDLRESGAVEIHWSVGWPGQQPPTRIAPGDRVFFIRHGSSRPGLIGSGRVIGEKYESTHWSEKRREMGQLALYAPVRFDALSEFPLISLEEIIEQTREESLWTREGTCHLIEPELAQRLESLWARMLASEDESTSLPHPPSDPIVFESLCLELWRDIWEDPNAKKCGRIGEHQDGVDIIGQDHGKWVAIRCKYVPVDQSPNLSASALDEAVQLAKNFRPRLSSFIVVTSGPILQQLRERARQLTERHRSEGSFDVEVWFWRDVWNELYHRRQLFERVRATYWPDDTLSSDSDEASAREFRATSTPTSAARVFISSTSEDLAVYRLAARDAVLAIGMLPVMVEYFAASGDKPPLPACLATVSETDVLVVIVGHRYGWVPPDQAEGQHKSITWLECEQAFSEGKEVLAFLVDDKHAWPEAGREAHRIMEAVQNENATGELLAEVNRNMALLKRFKDWIDDRLIRATFTTPEDLARRVAQSLNDWQLRYPGTTPTEQGETPSAKPLTPISYVERLLTRCGEVEVIGLQPKHGSGMRLSHVYAPLVASTRSDDGERKSSRRDEIPPQHERESKQLLLGLLDKQSLYVSADPGSGKSTFCRWVTWLTCNGEMPFVDLPAPAEYRETFPTSLRGRLPVLVRLRDFWQHLPAGVQSIGLGGMEQALERWLADQQYPDLDWTCLKAHLDHGSALLMLDGVDEVPPIRKADGEEWYPREMLLSGLADAVARWIEAGNRLLVTSRPYALNAEQQRRLALAHAPILGLDQSLQALLVRRWFIRLKESRNLGLETADAMINHIHDERGLDDLAANPLLLTAMCMIYDEGKRLPHDKYMLYDRIVDTVLCNRCADTEHLDPIRARLAALALGMHTGEDVAQQRTTPEVTASHREIDAILQAYEQMDGATYKGVSDTVSVREDLLSQSGLLVSRGYGNASFYHLSIQEFLAAERLVLLHVRNPDPLFLLFSERGQQAAWRNTLSFLFATVVSKLNLEMAVELLRSLVTHMELPKAEETRLQGEAHRESANDALAEARRLLASGDYLAARQRLSKIPRDRIAPWKAEFAFAFDLDQSEEEDRQRWENLQGQTEWRRKLWAALTFFQQPRPEDLIAPFGGPVTASADAVTESVVPQSQAKEVLDLPSNEKGELLEQDTLRILRRIFVFEDRDVILTKLRQQSRGVQLGCDVKLQFCRAAHNLNVRCLVECKSHETELRFAEVLEKLYQAKATQTDVDHWILIAPRARLVGNVPDGLVEKWNSTQEFPFHVQLWTRDSDVRLLFGLEPDVYERWIEHPEDEPHPRHWTADQREKTRRSFLQRLDPPLRLPQAWATYATEDTESGLFIENDDREALRALWQRKRYIPPRALDSSRSPLPLSLIDTLMTWLGVSASRVCLLLGDFGDGKTAFTYMLARQLLQQYREDSKDGWLPVRFPLRWFARPNVSARDFLRDRVERLGSSVSQWSVLVDSKNVLVILDGMDEMTKTLSADVVARCMELLIDCCNREFEQVKKLIITCRTPFFEELAGRKNIEAKLGKPRIVYLQRFERREVYEKLEQIASSSEQKLRLHVLRQMHDPIGLAGKALFFKMVSESLTSPSSDFSTETAIYQSYIESCLSARGKSELLEGSHRHASEADIRGGLLEIMERIAVETHLSGKDYVSLKKISHSTSGPRKEATDYAKLLWATVEDERGEGEEATHIVGVRSLLHKSSASVDEEDRGAWPVEFCHRSVREYFVARGMERALREGTGRAFDLISRVDFNHEILRFVAELMRKAGHDYEPVLWDLALMSRVRNDSDRHSQQEVQRRARLGRTAATLLYSWQGELPGTDWSCLTLDGAQLPHADLTGKDFHGTSLRSANLTNAVFVGGDFSGADLSGVRLEEAGEVCSLSVRKDLDGFFAGYADGSIRLWSLDISSHRESPIVFDARAVMNSQAGRCVPIKVGAFPGDGLCLYDGERVAFLNEMEERYQECAVFDVPRRYLSVTLHENGVVTVAKLTSCESELGCFDFSGNGLPAVEHVRTGTCVHCSLMGGKYVVTALEAGSIVVYPRHNTGNDASAGEMFQIADFVSPSALVAVELGNGDLDAHYLACGSRDGVVGLWRCEITSSGVNVLEVYREAIHDGPVTSLCFLDRHGLLSGSTDGRVLWLEITDTKLPVLKHVFELRLRCAGMKIEGLRGQRELDILKSAGAGR
jgi:hypothetical protein